MPLIYSNFLPEEPIKVIFTLTLSREEGHGGGRSGREKPGIRLRTRLQLQRLIVDYQSSVVFFPAFSNVNILLCDSRLNVFWVVDKTRCLETSSRHF